VTKHTDEQAQFRDTRAQDLAISPRKAGPRCLRYAGFMALALAALGLSAPFWRYLGGVSVRTASVQFATVVRGDLVREASGIGRVVAARSPNLYAANAGVVRLSVEAGAAVAAGALVAQIDSPELQSQLMQEQSSLLALKSDAARQGVANQRAALAKTRELDIARISSTAALREWQRAEKALAVHAMSEVDYLRAKDALDASALLVAAAERDLTLERESLRLELSNRAALVARQLQVVNELERQVAALKITAPFEGIVGQLLVPDRSSVAANTALLSIVDLHELELEVVLSQLYSTDLTVGLPAVVELQAVQSSASSPGAPNPQASGLRSVPASVRLVSPEIQNGQVSVRVRFAETPPDLRQNQQLNVRIRMEERKSVLRLPRGAFLDAQGGGFAWQRVGTQLKRVPIVLGASSIDAVEVRSGLREGDVIVSSALPEAITGDAVNLLD
jgi:HlyD family secretion protein